MRPNADISSRRPRWVAVGLNICRTTPLWKLGVILMAVGVCLTMYMAIGSLHMTSTPAVPSAVESYISSGFFIKSGRMGDEKQTDVPNQWWSLGDETLDTNVLVGSDVRLRQAFHKNCDTKTDSNLIGPVLQIDGSPAPRSKLVVVANSQSDGTQPPTVTQQMVGAGSEALTNISHYDRIGVVPVPCDPETGVSDLFQANIPKFLPEFKNPCWYEELSNPENVYKDNVFGQYSATYKKIFDKLRNRWLAEDTILPRYRLRCLPYFFIAGQPKCGSTDLYRRLTSHPDIVTAPTKEPHWWGKFRFGSCNFSDYVDLFDESALKIEAVTVDVDNSEPVHPAITGDASVSTLWSNDGWWKYGENCGLAEPRYTNSHLLHRILPRAKILVILRNPTDRLYSDFLYFHMSAKSKKVFHKQCQKAITDLMDCSQEVGLRACVYNYTIASVSRVRLRVGLYAVYLQEWLSLFPRDQVLVIRLEDYSARPLHTIEEVHRFLDLRSLSSEEDNDILEQPKWNTRRREDRKYGQMMPETRALLNQFYGSFNAQLALLLGDKRFLWKD